MGEEVNDLVERLRNPCKFNMGGSDDRFLRMTIKAQALCEEAAAEIERLTALVNDSLAGVGTK
jgi:hypothetical protein